MTDNPAIRMYVNKTENRITFRIRTVYYLELLTSVAMKLLGSTKKSKITRDENGQNAPYLEIPEVVLVIVNNDYLENSKVLYTFVRNKSFQNILDISP